MVRSEDETLEVKSEREYTFYTEYLLQNIRSASAKNLRAESLSDRTKLLNEELDLLITKNRAPVNFASQMRAAFKATQLPSSYFRWIDKKDERLCNWAWCYLRSHSSKKDTEQEQSLVCDGKLLSLYNKAFSLDRNNSEERYADIISAFYDGEAGSDDQKDILEYLKSKWQDVRFYDVVINWLEEGNPSHWAWAWRYLQNITQRPLEQAWMPSDDLEKRAVVIAMIDLSDNEDRKALVIDKMKKAWSQKKFREKSSGKKPYSISMTLNTKQKLNALAEEKGMKINEMVEFLIKSEYKKLQAGE